MNVIRARVLGFCGGVRTAVAKLEQAAEQYGKVYTLHEIVHNEKVTERLKKKHVIHVKSISDIPDGAVVAITAHGAPLSTIAELEERGFPQIDATCFNVRKAQQIVADNAQQGTFTLIYGAREHLEVQGLLSHGAGRAIAAESLDGLTLPSHGTIALCAQTTREPSRFHAFSQQVKAQLDDETRLLLQQETICQETVNRYQAARELSTRADIDVLVVVGSPNSANTAILKSVCEEGGKPTFLLSSADSIDEATFERFTSIGLTAGASTPDEIIDDMESRLRQIVSITSLD